MLVRKEKRLQEKKAVVTELEEKRAKGRLRVAREGNGKPQKHWKVKVKAREKGENQPPKTPGACSQLIFGGS